MRPSVRTSVGSGIAAIVLVAVVAGPDLHRAAAAEVRYEAEQATIVNGMAESEYPGFTGTGYVNSANALGAAIEFTVSAPAAGTRALVIRYANGTRTSRPATVAVNGSMRATLQFPATGGWSTWRTQTLSTPLSAGANLVRLAATTSRGLANVDSLSYDDGLPSSPSPSVPPTGSVPPRTPIADPIPQAPIRSELGLVLTQFVDGSVYYTNETERIRGGGLTPLHQLRILTGAGTETSMAVLAGDSRVDLRLGIDRAGELYLLAKANGRIWKVTATRTSS